MNFDFVPTLDISNKKINYYATSCNISDGILTPTTPSSSKLITTDNNSYYNALPPPFQPFTSTSNSYDTGNYPIEFSPSNKPSYDEYYNNSYGHYTSTSVADTPDSIGNRHQFNYDDTYFRFDPEIIEKFTTSTDILNLDTDYVNYNEENCNSKNQSPCSSPMDPWIISSAMVENSERNSPKIENTQLLPSINQAFSNHFINLEPPNHLATEKSCINVTPYNNILESFDSTLFDDDFGIIIKAEENVDAYINPDNYNCITFEDKPNREFKDIWSESEVIIEQKAINEVEKAEISPPKEKKSKKNFKKIEQKIIEEVDELEDDSIPQQLICLWTDCYQEFKTQSGIVSHIEKSHVSLAKSLKGDEYTCLWADCPRQYRSFNARYKLLIHMRVHSGEKPNQCPVNIFL